MNQQERRVYLIRALLAEHGDAAHIELPHDAEGQQALLRALMNVRPPAPIAPEVLAVQDAYLAERLAERGGAVNAATLVPISADAGTTVCTAINPASSARTAAPAAAGHSTTNPTCATAPAPTSSSTGNDAARPANPDPAARIVLWHGDITTLAADAIVNAANSQLLGCFVVGHTCIDNAIHTFAGMQLRLTCTELMRTQGHDEPPGRVKVTSGFNLPARFVFHTVGPIVHDGRPTARDRELLASCYRACLAEATRRRLDTLAFCCISTGLFGFPQAEAARIAIETVREHLAHTDPHLKVIFDVFTNADQRIYQELLGGAQAPRP